MARTGATQRGGWRASPAAGQLGVGERVDPLYRAGEVGVDLEAVRVRDHEQRRVRQVLAVEEVLGVRGGEILVAAP
jgi:hypothetical protein